MSAASTAASSTEALPRGTDGASAAASTALPFPQAALPAASALTASVAAEVAAVQQRIAALEKKIDGVEARRDAHAEGTALWMEYNGELKQLRTEKEQLRDELKRKELALEHRVTAGTGEHQHNRPCAYGRGADATGWLADSLSLSVSLSLCLSLSLSHTHTHRPRQAGA